MLLWFSHCNICKTWSISVNIRLCSCGLLYRFGWVVYDYMRDVSPQLTGQCKSWQAVAPSEMLFIPSTCPDTRAVLQICTTSFLWAYKVLCIIWACISGIWESIKCPCVSCLLPCFSTSMSRISLISWFFSFLCFQVLKKHFASNFFLAVVTWKSCVVRDSSSAPLYKVCCECWTWSSK